MDETTEKVTSNEDIEQVQNQIPESPKPMAFTVNFDDGKVIDTQRYKNLFEKYQSRHKRGQSLSKFDESPSTAQPKKHPLTGKLPRKSSFNSEGYFSSDEKDRIKHQGARSTVLNTVISKGDLTLPLRNITSDRMTQSFPSRSFDLPSINSPEIELKDVSSPELDLISPISPLTITNTNTNTSTNDSSNSQSSSKQKLTQTCKANRLKKLTKQHSSPEVETMNLTPTSSDTQFVDATEFDFDKTDTVSDAGTYTLDGDNYTEEQKARMSIDKYYNIEQVSVIEKTQKYIQSLNIHETSSTKFAQKIATSPTLTTTSSSSSSVQILAQKLITEEPKITKKVFNKVLYPSQKCQASNTNEEPTDSNSNSNSDQGVFTSITASGVLSKRPEKRGHIRRSSLVQSEIFVEAYTGDTTIKQPYDNVKVIQTVSNSMKSETNQVQFRNKQRDLLAKQKRRSLNLDEVHKSEDIDSDSGLKRVTNLPPAIGGGNPGKHSPTATKIPSPVHTINRPRSRNSLSSQNQDFSDSSLETESYLKPTQNIISSLQARLSLDSDQDSDYEHRNYAIALNNETTTKNLIKSKPMHVRHNSFDDRTVKISNKLEHFHQKNLQGIDQTFKSCNQYAGNQNKQIHHRIQNSPNNSPIRRSSSFSLKNQFDQQPKCLNTNTQTKESNLTYNSPHFQQRNGSATVQRSASTANIKPNIELRRASVTSDQKINKPQFLDTEESSTDDDFERSISKNKKDLTTTRYNRAFSLRRARLDAEAPPAPKCPNTPEMRRKFAPNDKERTVSVDRKSGKTPDVQSRYMNISKSSKNVTATKVEVMTPKPTPKLMPNKPPVFSRTDTGRFSMRTPKPNSAPRPVKKEQSKKQSGPRSNSTLSSREVEFQNWKRRKSYDPMKAAAEGKRKAELARKQNQNVMTQSYNESQDCDSSPSHSSSVHRSQSFHGTAALEQLLSSDEEDLTLSGEDEGFSPPTPSPCELSPSKSNLRHIWMDRFTSKR